MKHPTPEQWSDYLYGELAPVEREQLQAHLAQCASCRAQEEGLRATLASLDSWQVQAPPKRHKHHWTSAWGPGWKWAAAAALLLSTAFAAGRLSRPQVDWAEFQARVAKPLEEKWRQEALLNQKTQLAAARDLAEAREKMQAELAAKLQQVSDESLAKAAALSHARLEQLEQLTRSLAAVRDEDQRKIYTALQTFETQRVSEYRSLREDIERVALFADQNLRNAQRQLVHLASTQN